MSTTDRMMGNETGKMKGTLQPGHLIHTLVSEHEKILAFLDELEKVNREIQNMESYKADREEFKKLQHIADHLVGAEPHHKREEEVLFPEMEERGVYGPPQMMRMEHDELRSRKRAIKDLAESVNTSDFSAFKKQLDTAARFVVLTLRDHVYKENNILYPMALEVIQEEEVWQKLKEECDRIGYCCFTPTA